MSTLRSALDELRAEDLRLVDDDGLVSDLDELERAGRIIEAERARRLAEFERRGSFGVDGHLSLASWLADRHQVAHSVAASRLHLARALEQMPATAAALGSGELSVSAVTALAAARDSLPEAFAASEELLLEAARMHSPSGLRRVIDHWKQVTDAGGAAAEEERRFQSRHLHASPTLRGMVRVDGDLDVENGQVVITALRARMDADVRGGVDRRTPAQRRADALGDICRWWLDSSDRPSVGGERPHVMVVMDLDSLRARAGGRCELQDAGAITPETARRLACDASVSRVITDASSVPLELGRRTKVVSASLRRAVVVRDRTCRFPGCDRPPGWCDSHHIVHWADGGETALSNLVLLCRAHHRMVHNRRFGIEMVHGQPVFSRPDGTRLGDRGPP